MENDAGGEAITEPVAEPTQMPGGVAVGCGAGFDLDPHDPTAGQLGEQVDLVAALLLSKVVEARTRLGDGGSTVLPRYLMPISHSCWGSDLNF